MDDLLEIAVKMEENGEAVYLDSKDKLASEELKSTLQWMANEEASHAKWFKTLKQRLTLSVDEADLKKMVPRALQEMMGDNTLALEEIDFSTIKTARDLFETFIGFEKETIEFYEVLEIFIDDPGVIKGLQEIIREEKNHIKTLESRMDDHARTPVHTG